MLKPRSRVNRFLFSKIQNFKDKTENIYGKFLCNPDSYEKQIECEKNY